MTKAFFCVFKKNYGVLESYLIMHNYNPVVLCSINIDLYFCKSNQYRLNEIMLRYVIIFLCVCAVSVLSASVAVDKCGPVCAIYCYYGNVLDDKGCPTCQCKTSPCPDEKKPLDGYFCGRGPNRQDCPSSHHCVISPVDAYAVCCPNIVTITKPPRTTQRPTRTTTKPGTCPKVSEGTIGICIAECTTDNDCKGNLKCCGNCPRKCVAPVRWLI